MTIAKVTGTVVSTNKDEKLTGMKMLIVQPMDIAKMRVKGEMAVAIVAIIDHIDIGDKRVFEKYSSTGNVNTSKRK